MKIAAIRITSPTPVYVTDLCWNGLQSKVFEPGEIVNVKSLPEADKDDQISATNATVLLQSGQAEPHTPA